VLTVYTNLAKKQTFQNQRWLQHIQLVIAYAPLLRPSTDPTSLLNIHRCWWLPPTHDFNLRTKWKRV